MRFSQSEVVLLSNDPWVLFFNKRLLNLTKRLPNRKQILHNNNDKKPDSSV